MQRNYFREVGVDSYTAGCDAVSNKQATLYAVE